ncbi:hypothetical protein FQA39_LY14829 [Lamprigera yunnana]|nr:hypothetical protein FQA39_LY14829 [Lamprigera yunnana]
MSQSPSSFLSKRSERNFPSLDLTATTKLNMNTDQPILVIQSPKTPTLSRKLKAVSLDSDPIKMQTHLEANRNVSSMPNTPKKQIRQKQSLEFEENGHKTLLGSNLKRFASNSSISGSQTLKTLPEVMTLQDFSDSKPEPIRIKAKGLLERRGSNASLTIDLGSNSSISEARTAVTARLNSAKSTSHLNLATYNNDKCFCEVQSKKGVRVNQAECNGNSVRARCYTFHKKCNCLCNFKCRRKSLSNENLYVPPCSFCQSRLSKDCTKGSRNCKGCRKAMYPRQPDLEPTHLLSEDFKLHLQNVQYLQTAGSILSIADLRASCEPSRVPKLHQEFWEVPLNLQEKCLVSGTQSKNRYKGVLPNENSRVHLSGTAAYIHANYIKGPDYSETAYIATQGPMEHTCEDFWEMVWTSQSKCIVMLTGLIEKGKSKCELYFPLGKTVSDATSYYKITTIKLQDRFMFDAANWKKYESEVVSFEELNELKYGSYNITFCGKENLGECTIRKLNLSKNSESRRIYHYWFSTWQDHKMANPEQVLQVALHILELVNSFDNNSINNGDNQLLPIIVHCSAGIGRTGCFLAILNGIQQLKSNFNVDILAILCSLRLSRGGMVQTAEQYELIHRVLSLYTEQLQKV